MGTYRYPRPSDAVRTAYGTLGPRQKGGIVFESAMAGDYALMRLGVTTESGLAAPQTGVGDLLTTDRGDHITSTSTTINPATGVSYTDVVRVDVGFGADALRTVREEDDSPINNDFTDEGVVSESVPYQAPEVEENSSSYYVEPETPATEGGDYVIADAPAEVGGFDTGGGTEETVYWSEPEPSYDNSYDDARQRALDDAIAGWETEETDFWS